MSSTQQLRPGALLHTTHSIRVAIAIMDDSALRIARWFDDAESFELSTTNVSWLVDASQCLWP